MDQIFDQLLKLLEDAAIRAAFLSLFGVAVIGGFKAFIVKVAVKFLFNEIAEPTIETAYRKGMLYVDKSTGKIKAKRVRNATENGDSIEWDASIDEL